MPSSERRSPVNQARRHFVGLAAAAGARIAALGAFAATVTSPSEAAGKPKGGPKPGRGNGRGGGNGNPKCLLRGTAILTAKGETAIEDLRIGDLVMTVRGDMLPVEWIGRHVYRRGSPTWHESVMPIRVCRFALDDRTPRKDLYLSSGHALYIDGVLIRATDLVNGTSITRTLPGELEVLEYYHLVLATHQVVLAEGAPVETFLLEDCNYEDFTNFAEFARLYPDRLQAAMTSFAPFVGYAGREHLKALLRLATGRLVRPRSLLQDTYERVAARGEKLLS